MSNMTDSQRWFIYVSVLSLGVLIYLLSPVFAPFLISGVLAYLADPVIDRLEHWKFSRLWAAVVVFAIMFSIIVGVFMLIVPLIEGQITAFIDNIPSYADKFKNEIWAPLASRLGIENLSLDGNAIKDGLAKNWKEAGHSLGQVLGVIGYSGAAIINFFMYIILIPVITFYLMRDWPKLLLRIQAMIPRSQKQIVTELTIESDRVLGGFLRGQLMVMLILGLIYSVGLQFVGLQSSFLIGMLTGLLSFVPYLGFVVGISVASIAMLVQQAPDPQFIYLLYIAIVFGIGQIVESVFLTPVLIGDKIGLHPVAIIFAILAGGQLFGFTGVLLALPVAAIVVVWLHHAYKSYTSSDLYQDG